MFWHTLFLLLSPPVALVNRLSMEDRDRVVGQATT